jgi:hypothetical protein
MALPAKRVPESVAHLDVEIVAAALIHNDANIRNTARALGVPSGDLRKLVLIDQRLAEPAIEAVELRLDEAEANLCEALHCGDPRRRDAVSMFMLRNTQRASKRGYAVAASASLEVGLNNQAAAQTVVLRWGDDPAREMETIERDGREISIPRYDNGRGDGCIEGEVAIPAVLIEHAAAVASEPEPAAPTPMEALSVVPEPESPAARYERERIDAWIRNRLIAYPLASCLLCRKPIIAGQDWQEVSNGDTNARARFHRTCHAEWRTEREAAARQALGLEGLNLPEAKGRDVCAALTLPVRPGSSSSTQPIPSRQTRTEKASRWPDKAGDSADFCRATRG